MRRSWLFRLWRNRSGAAGLILIVLFLAAALAGALGLTPYPPNEQHAKDRMQPPSRQYIFGTDEFGRDVYSRLIRGATNSLSIAFVSVALASVAGATLGTVGGYFGGRTDNTIMRIMDLFFAFPAILLALAIIAALGPGFRNTILAISIVYMPIFARVARGPVLTVRATEYVTAARCIGAKHGRILGRHVFPNITPPLIVQVSLALSWAILTEAGLELPGSRHPAARTVVGQHVERGSIPAGTRAVAGDFPGPGDHVLRAGLQSARRWAERRSRPPDAGSMRFEAAVKAEAKAFKRLIG